MNGAIGLDAEQKVDSLAAQLQELIGLCEKLKGENSALRAQERELSVERAKLIEKNELVRSRVEAMISRLKAMEGG
jgi:cell division protein ZapB